jgi:hypothetical protein
LQEKSEGHQPGIAGLGRDQQGSRGDCDAVANVGGRGGGEEPSKIPPEATGSDGFDDSTHNRCTLLAERGSW